MASKSFRTSGTDGSRDETGLLTVSVPYYAADESEVFAVGVVNGIGLREVGRKWSDIDGLEGFSVTVDYEGFEDGKDEDEGASFEFDPSFAEEPIESHANFLDIKEKYGGTLDDQDKVKWPETIKGGDGKHGLGTPNTGTEEKNPMLGVSTYLALRSVFRKTYTVRNLPSDLLDEIGAIVEDLPNGFPTPAGRDWIKLPPKISTRGNVYQISEEWMLSPVGRKWPEGIHGLIEK